MTEAEFGGKAIVVTGAASGLGRATALAFAREGARLALADIDEAGLAATVASATKLGAEAHSVPTNMADTAACTALIDATVAQFGAVDVVCNVAGAFRFDHATDIAVDVWDRIFAVNVRGPFFLIQAALPHLIESQGAVVNVASASAFLGHAFLAHYAASKAALVKCASAPITSCAVPSHCTASAVPWPCRVSCIVPARGGCCGRNG